MSPRTEYKDLQDEFCLYLFDSLQIGWTEPPIDSVQYNVNALWFHAREADNAFLGKIGSGNDRADLANKPPAIESRTTRRTFAETIPDDQGSPCYAPSALAGSRQSDRCCRGSTAADAPAD